MNVLTLPRGRKAGTVPARPSSSGNEKKEDEGLDLESYLTNRDYLGACALLEFQQQTGEGGAEKLPWLGYAAFHLGDFKKAYETYQTILKEPKADAVNRLYSATCLYHMGHYKEAQAEAALGPATKLQNRILVHCARKLGDDQALRKHAGNLTNDVMDALSGAALQYMRGHFQEATDEYQAIFKEHSDFDAIHMYIAMCCYKLDHFKFSLEFLQKYLQAHPDSATALNLKACNQYRLLDGASAESEIKTLSARTKASAHQFDSDLIRHNMVVFRAGEDAMKYLPPLIDVMPEARFNLVVYHMRMGNVEEAYKLVKDLQPTTPQDYIIKGVANAALAVDDENSEFAKEAQHYFNSVGSSASEKDTIPGRKCMAQLYFFQKRWEDVLLYLSSIEEYSNHDSVFNHNYGIALACNEDWREAQARLLMVKDESILSDPCYICMLTRCHIMNHEPDKAWNLYFELENPSLDLLALVASDCYRIGEFYFAFRAYDMLYRMDPAPEVWEGKRGAACGVLQMVVAGREKKDAIREVINLMRKHTPPNPQADLIARVMSKWAQENGINVS